jgi:outer membrane protein assembly factor BamB
MKYLILSVLGVTAVAAGLLVAGRRQGAPALVAPMGAAGSAEEAEPPGPDDWPWWRGPHGDGTAAGTPPVTWSASVNVAWKAAVPGHGHAAPIIRGDRVYLASADDEAGVQSLLCYERSTGSLLWNKELHRGGLMACHDKNSHASATPACDGRRVYAAFINHDSLWLDAVERDGAVAWQTQVGPFVSEWGYGSSVVLYRGLVIVSGENKGSKLGHVTGTSSYLAAVRAANGEVVWRARRPRAFSYGTPAVAPLCGRDQLVLAGAEAVTAYDPDTGAELWRCPWPAGRTAGTVALGDDHVFAATTVPCNEWLCVRANGGGNVGQSHVQWRHGRAVPDVPSPVYHAGRLYAVTDSGQAVCLEAASGEILWQQRLGGSFSASPVLANGLLYAVNESGTTYVFKAGPKFEQVAKNVLPEPVFATPAVAGRQLFVRGRQSLFCLEAARPSEATARRD